MEKQEQTTYNTPNGIIKKIDIFKGKRVLVGDYLNCSFMNTEMVLDSLGFEIVRETAEPMMFYRVARGEKFDLIITNNIYRIGYTGPELLKRLKEIKGFNTPVIIHTISEKPIEYFLNLGFDGCLKKPIRQDETIEILKKYCS